MGRRSDQGVHELYSHTSPGMHPGLDLLQIDTVGVVGCSRTKGDRQCKEGGEWGGFRHSCETSMDMVIREKDSLFTSRNAWSGSYRSDISACKGWLALQHHNNLARKDTRRALMAENVSGRSAARATSRTIISSWLISMTATNYARRKSTAKSHRFHAVFPRDTRRGFPLHHRHGKRQGQTALKSFSDYLRQAERADQGFESILRVLEHVLCLPTTDEEGW